MPKDDRALFQASSNGLRRSAFLVLLLLWLGLGASQADTWQRAEVYYLEWDVATRGSLTPEQVRKFAAMAGDKVIFRNEAPAVARLLETGKLLRAKNQQPEDARVVIDLIDDTMHRHTYYASRFNLCSADSKYKRPIDESFRKMITRLAKQHQLP